MEAEIVATLSEHVLTWKNGLIVIACGAAMEAFKRGPITRTFAESKIGQVLQYYAPLSWCWLALFLPVGLAPEGYGVGEKVMLGVVLATATSSVYEWSVKAARAALEKAGAVAIAEVTVVAKGFAVVQGDGNFQATVGAGDTLSVAPAPLPGPTIATPAPLNSPAEDDLPTLDMRPPDDKL